MAIDPFDLQRFVSAQASVFDRALDELRAARKRSHWMWFIFPQARGLGLSDMATHYGIGSLEEAGAYLAHPVLGPRLRQCTEAVLAAPAGAGLHDIFGSPDDMKFGSSMTLFALAAGGSERCFTQALDRFCAGRQDARTLDLLGTDPGHQRSPSRTSGATRVP